MSVQLVKLLYADLERQANDYLRLREQMKWAKREADFWRKRSELTRQEIALVTSGREKEE